MLNVFMDIDKGLAYLACQANQSHESIVRESSQYQQKGLEALNIITRRHIMENQFGIEKSTALERYHGVTSLTKEQAKEILLTVFPDVPEVELMKAMLICANYSLNPLMGHLFLIPFRGMEGTSWATVIGIKAKRLLASRKRAFSYIDDSPRIMSDEEQKRVFGKVDEKHLIAITILQDQNTKAIARGYGSWEVNKEPYGIEKGNSKENMAFIRSESQALDRLCPGEMPIGFEVVDEQFIANAPEREQEGDVEVERDIEEVLGNGPPAIAQEERRAGKLKPKAQAPQPKEIETDAAPECFIDLDKLKKSLTTLQSAKLKAWTNDNVLSYLDTLTGKKHSRISEACRSLNKEQANEFVKRVQETLDMV